MKSVNVWLHEISQTTAPQEEILNFDIESKSKTDTASESGTIEWDFDISSDEEFPTTYHI